MDEMATMHRAREAIARGDLGMARQLLAGLLHEQPGSETAWMMMATLVDQSDRKRDCLARVLRINPRNDAARLELEAMGAEPEPAETAPAPEVALDAEAEEPLPEPAPLAEREPEPAETAPAPEAAFDAEELLPEPAPLAERELEPAAEAAPAPEAAFDAEELLPEPAPLVEPKPEPAVEAAPAPEAVRAAETEEALPRPAPVSDEDATVLGNSLLIDSLAPGERVLHRTTLTPWVFLSPLAAVVAAVIVVSLPGGSLPEGLVLAYRAGLLVLAFAYFGLRALRYFGSEYLVTDRRVLATRGLLARQRVDIPLREIEEVTVGRASTRSGSLWIRRSDGPRVMFWRIREPGVFRDAIERARAAGSEARSF
jgi:hypothetical protein